MSFLKSIVVLVLLTGIACNKAHGQSYDIHDIRKKFFALTFDSEKAPEFYEYLMSIASPTPTIIAYRGATEALLTKHEWSPFAKLEYLRMSQTSLTNAVVADSENLEVRFIRYAVEKNIPRFLGFSQHVNEDEKIIAVGIKEANKLNIDPSFTEYIINFMIENSDLPNEKIYELRLVLK